MTKLVNITPTKVEDPKGVRELLLQAIEQNFDEVHVIALKDGLTYLKSSDIESNMKTIGAIEMLKLQIFHNSGR
jgi:hypothetical protein